MVNTYGTMVAFPVDRTALTAKMAMAAQIAVIAKKIAIILLYALKKDNSLILILVL
jgi:hypothetical protein